MSESAVGEISRDLTLSPSSRAMVRWRLEEGSPEVPAVELGAQLGLGPEAVRVLEELVAGAYDAGRDVGFEEGRDRAYDQGYREGTQGDGEGAGGEREDEDRGRSRHV
jgi:hypothetical protein